MMMVFGLFVFELRTLPYQQLQLSRNCDLLPVD